MSDRLAPGWLTARPIAHRGLHDRNAGIPENTVAAAEAAIGGGYAIECDVQLSRDGEAMVFHDAGLGRLTGADGLVRERDAADLAGLTVLGSGGPVFAGARVPLRLLDATVLPDSQLVRLRYDARRA